MRDRKKYKVLAVLVICALFFGMVQTSLSKAAVNIIDKGKLGEILWQLDSEGVLSFEGNGEFPAFQKEQMPWRDHLTEIKKVIFVTNTVSGGDISSYFSGCVKLQTVNHISVGITKLDEAFAGCTALVSVGKIPDTVLSMNRAFKNCKVLDQEVMIPESVEQAAGAFDGCRKLTHTPLIESEKIKDMSYMFRETAITRAPHIPNDAEDLSYTFCDCEVLKTPPVIPEGVKRMDHTFENCYEISAAPMVPGSVESLSYGFHSCMSMASPPTIMAGQLRDMSGAFMGCSELQAAPVIPEGVTNMDYAFYGCEELRKGPDIPASVTDMSYCMAYCPEVCGTMTIYTVIQDRAHYYRFAGDTSIYQVNDNPAFLGGCGSGLKVNYVDNNKAYIASYLSYGWNAGTLANCGSFGKLSVGGMEEQDVSSCSVRKLTSCTYNGFSQRPEPEVYYSSLKLKKGTDYTLSYENNINAGTARLTIQGKGNYTGQKTVYFTIHKAAFSSVKSYDYLGVYDGNPHSIAVTCDEGTTVEYGTEEGQYTTAQCPEYTLPGTYVTYFQVTKPNYETYAGSARVTIQERQLEVESQGFSGDYDGNPHSIQVQTEEGAVIRYGTKQGEYTTTICPSYINVGRYTVYYEVSKTGCAVYTGKRLVIIKRKPVEELIFPEVSDIIQGESLRAATLSFSYNQYGIFTWESPDTVPETGDQEQVLIFTPNDILNYDFGNVPGYDEKEKLVRRRVFVRVKESEQQKPPEPAGTLEPSGPPVTESGTVEQEQKADEKPDVSEPGGNEGEEEAYNESWNTWIDFVVRQINADKVSQRKTKEQRPDGVKIRKIKRTKKKFSLFWKKIKGADGYQVVYTPKKAMKKSMRQRVVQKTRISIKWNLKKRYYVRIRAYKGQGKKRIYGKWSKIRCVKRCSC